MSEIDQKRVLLTGASGEIGSAVAMRLASLGARLALSARREQRLRAVADKIADLGHPPAVVLPADLGRVGEGEELGRRAIDALGGVDVVINNAGACVQGLTWLVGDRDEAREVFETNVWSPAALVAALAPQMLERGSGTIVNVGSMARVSPFPHLGHYSASRAALSTLTEVMGMELRPRGIRVVELALGPVDTPASHENRRLAGADRWLDGRPGLGSVDAAADAMVAAVSNDVRGVAFYPRMLRWPHRFPGLGRGYSRRTARRADLTDPAIRFGGSGGDHELVTLREEWEAARRPPA
jgi:short-subunit dehydrogenase